MTYNPRRGHRPFGLAQGRRSIRLKGYDYTHPGAYFVTICAHQRAELFGAVAGGEMRLNANGEIVAERWRWLADQYRHVQLDAWVIMPNHFHGILILADDRRGGSRPAPTITAPDDIPTSTTTARDNVSAPGPDETKRKSLDQLIGAFKTVSAKHINQLRQTPGAPVWQRNYYDHIVRNDRELNAIRRYIRDNPAKWTLDRDNAGNTRRLPVPASAADYLADLD